MKRRRFLTVTPGFLLTTAALLYLDSVVMISAAAAAVVHELGHWGAIRTLGGRVRRLNLSAVGAELALDGDKALSYPRELAAALAGPAASLLCAWIAAGFGWFLFAGLSLALGLFNLLPATRLDGGRAVYALLAWLIHEQCAARVSWTLSILVASALLALGVTLLHLGGSFTLLVAAIWLLVGAVKQQP